MMKAIRNPVRAKLEQLGRDMSMAENTVAQYALGDTRLYTRLVQRDLKDRDRLERLLEYEAKSKGKNPRMAD